MENNDVGGWYFFIEDMFMLAIGNVAWRMEVLRDEQVKVAQREMSAVNDIHKCTVEGCTLHAWPFGLGT